MKIELLIFIYRCKKLRECVLPTLNPQSSCEEFPSSLKNVSNSTSRIIKVFSYNYEKEHFQEQQMELQMVADTEIPKCYSCLKDFLTRIQTYGRRAQCCSGALYNSWN